MRALLLLFTLLLSACASTLAPYQPAAGARGFGYSELRIESDRYRVSYRGPSGADAETVQDLALLRAAEIGQAQGFDWFVVDQRRLEGGKGGGVRPTGGVGVSAGSGGYSGVGVGIGVNLGGGSPAEASLEARFGRGAKPEGGYAVADVLATLGPRAIRP